MSQESVMVYLLSEIRSLPKTPDYTIRANLLFNQALDIWASGGYSAGLNTTPTTRFFSDFTTEHAKFPQFL